MRENTLQDIGLKYIELTNSPVHQLINSSAHQLINSSAHQLTSSPAPNKKPVWLQT
ncbi:MAG: hypothetical protein R6U46_10180 [Marinilabilia sp.]